jgi:FKBP-type peptidyl-prolyl cis-trans isomerase
LKPSGLYYCDSVVGTGLRATTHDEAYVKYTGKFLDETVFDTNVGKVDTLFFPVNEGWLIPGLDEGITYMNAGGKAILLLPSNLAYGIAGYYPVIPGNTSVIYEVYLVRLVVR